VTARDGVATVGTATYILAIATNNPVQFAQYRAAGLPAHFQPETVSSQIINESGTSATIDWNFVGDGLDHTIHAITAEPPPGTITSSTSTFYFDEQRGDVRLTFSNLFGTNSTAAIFADLSGASAITPLLALPTLQFINGARFSFTRGGWTGTLEQLD
jgi:hypothetical protein